VAGKAFVADRHGAGDRVVGREVQQPQQRLAFAGQFGVGQAEPGGGALAGDHQQQVGAQ
jgi:hypothetical protein